MRKGMSVVVWERERGVDLALEAERGCGVSRGSSEGRKGKGRGVCGRGLRYERVCVDEMKFDQEG